MIRATIAQLDAVNAGVGRDFPGADFEDFLSDPLHVCLMEGESGALFAWRGPGIFEAHIFYAAKGRAALDLARRMIERMRVLYGARMFWALIPTESRKVKLFVRWLGWKSHGQMETKNGPCELYVLGGL